MKNCPTDRSHQDEHFYQVRIWLNLTVFEIYVKKLLSDPLCSIFSKQQPCFSIDQKSPHQFYAEYPKEHSYQVWLNWSSSARGEDFLKIVNDDDGRQVMAKAHMACSQAS